VVGFGEERVDRHEVPKFGGSKIKSTGDGVFAVFDGPTKAAHCALELVPALATRNINIRAGVHPGECERRGDDWSGVGVHIGASPRSPDRARCSQAGPFETSPRART